MNESVIKMILVILEYEETHVYRPPGQWVFQRLLSRDPRTSKSPVIWLGALKEHQMAGEVGPLKMGVCLTDQRQLAICCGQISQDGHPPTPPPRPPLLREAASSCEGSSCCPREGGKGPTALGGSRRWSAKQSCGTRGLLPAVGRGREPAGQGEAGRCPPRALLCPCPGSPERGTPSYPHRALSPAHTCVPWAHPAPVCS